MNISGSILQSFGILAVVAIVLAAVTLRISADISREADIECAPLQGILIDGETWCLTDNDTLKRYID